MTSVSLQDTFIAFQFWAASVIVLQDNGDVWLCDFRDGAAPNSPLSMRPPSEDNYSSDPCSILVLSLELCVVVIANGNGMLHHCIFYPTEVCPFLVAVMFPSVGAPCMGSCDTPICGGSMCGLHVWAHGILPSVGAPCVG